MASRVEEGSSQSELDIAFRFLVDNIGLNWRTLAPELGLTPGQIGWVTRQCGGNVMKEVFQCLCTWKETFSEKATVQELVRALHKTKVRLLSRMADEIVKKCPSARNQMLSTLPKPGRKRKDVNLLSVSLPTKRQRWGTVQSSKGTTNGSKVTSPQNVKVHPKQTASQVIVRKNGGEGSKTLQVKGNTLKSSAQSSLTVRVVRSEGKGHDLKSKGQSSVSTGNSRQSNSSASSATSSRTESKPQSTSSSSLPKKVMIQKGSDVRIVAEIRPKQTTSNKDLRPRRECTVVKKEDTQKPETSKVSEVKDDSSAKKDKVEDDSDHDDVVAEIMILDEKTGRLVLGKKKPGQGVSTSQGSAATEQDSVQENTDFHMREVVNEIKKTYRKLFCVPEVFLFGSLVRLNVAHVYTQLQMVDRDTQTPVEDIGSIITPQAQTVRAGTVMLVTPRRILIEGEQGIGKSTFCHKISYNWGCTLFNVYVQFSLVFKIDLSSVRADIVSTVCHQLLEVDTKMKRSDMRAFIEKRQHETLFILDGLDQLPAHAHPEYLALMKKEILPKACVIVTTRPLEQLPCEFDSYYVMKGFTPEKRKEYVRRHLGRLSLKVIEELHSVWQLDEIIRNPLNAVLLCRLYEINQGLPDTFTAMFTKLVMGVVGWNCHRKGIEMKGEEIPSAVHQIIASLGHIAWEGLRNGLMSFDVSELRRCYPITNEILKFGFLMFVMPEEPCGQSLRCTFSHRVFQEIFSACYISTMARLTPDSELTAAYLRLCTQEGFQQVCVFVSGLLKDKSEILFQQLAAQIKFCSELNRPVGAPGTMNPLDDTLYLALLCLHETGEVDRFAPLVASHFAKRLFISDWSSKSCLQSIVSILQYQDAQQPDEVQETTAEVSETAAETAANGTADSTAIQPAEEKKEAPESKIGEEQKPDNVEKMDTSVPDPKCETPDVEGNKGAQDLDSKSEEGSSPLKSKALVTENTDQATDTQRNGTTESRSKAEDEEEMEVEISKDQKESKKELDSEGKDEDCTTCEKEADQKHGAEKDDGNTKDAMKKKDKQSPLKQPPQDSRTLRRGRSRTSSTLPDEKEEKEESDKETEEKEDKEADRKRSKKNVDALKETKVLKDMESSEEEEEQQKGGRNTRSRTRQDSSKDRKVSRRGKDNSEGEEDQSPCGRGKIPESPRRSSRRKESLSEAPVDPVGSRTRSTSEGKKGGKINSLADDNDDKNEGYVDPIGSRTRRRTRSDAQQGQVGGSSGPKPATRTSPRAKAARRDKSSGSEQEFVDPVGLRTRTRARGANVQSPSKERKPSAKENTTEVDEQDKEEKMSEEESQEGEFIDPIGLRVRGRRAKSIAREQLRVIADDKFELRRQESTRMSPRSRAREMSSLPKSPGRGRPRKSSEGEGKEEKARPGRRQSPKGEDRQKGPKIKWGKGVQGKGKSPPKPKKEEEEEKEEDKTEEAEDVREKDAEETSKEDINGDDKTQKDGEQQEKEETGPGEEEEEEVLEEEPEKDQAGLNSLEISIFASNLQIVFRALRNNRIIRTLTFTDRFLPATRNICHLDWFDSLGELFLHNTSLRTLIIDSANYRVTRGAFTNVVTAAVTSKSLQTIQLKFELHQKAEKTSGYIRLGIPLEKLTESPSLQTVSVELTSKMTSHEEAANDVTRTVVKLLKKPSNLKKVSFTVKEKDSYFLQVLPVLRAMQVNSTISDFSIDMGAQPSTRYTLAAIKEVLTFNTGLTSLRVKFHTPAPVNSDDLTEVFTAVENSDLRAFTLDMGCGWSTDPLDPPVLALADLLANNNTLRKLYVRLDCPWSPQAISNDTIALLCAAMYANSTVKELNISGIYTAEDNGPRIIQALLKHKGTKFTIDMPYWWNAYCQVAADYCEGIVMEHYFDKEDTEGSGKKKKKKKEATTPKKEEKTAADSKEPKPGTSSTETKTAAESEEILTVTDSSESSETDEGNPSTKTTSQKTDTTEKAVDSTEKSTCKPSSSETDKSKQCPELSKMLTTDSKKLATDKSDLCPELSKMLTTETDPPKKTEEKEDKEAEQDTNTKEGSTESRDVENTEKREGESETPSVEEETPSCSGHSKGKGKAKSPSDSKPPVASHPVPVSTRRTTAAALIQAGDDLPEFLNQFPEYKNARMIRSGRIMVNVEVDCLGSTGYGSGFLSDTFKLTEAGRKKLELIKTREAKNTVAVRETLFCSGKTNCQRECGGIGDCIRGCNKDSNRGHRCSFRVKLHMYMDRLNFWEVTVEGEHLPSATGQQWIPYNKHSHMYVRNGVWSTLDQ